MRRDDDRRAYRYLKTRLARRKEREAKRELARLMRTAGKDDSK